MGEAITDNKHARYKIDIEKAVRLRLENHLSFQEIANYFNCTKQSVNTALKPYVNTQYNLKAVRNNKASLLEQAQAKVLLSLSDDDIKKASLVQKTTAFGTLYDKQRLEEGKSTSNIAMQDINSEVSNLQKEREALEAELDNL